MHLAQSRTTRGGVAEMAQLGEWVSHWYLLVLSLLFILIELYDLILKPEEFDTTLQGFAKKRQLPFENADAMFESIPGYGLGGSSIALFGRVGGGIYMKAADVGADPFGQERVRFGRG